MAPSSLSSAPEETPPRPPFLTLPLEIVDLIADNYLTLCDCKSLRLTCHFFEMPMIRPLFRRVVLSKTKLDHDNFFNIASSPTLAAAARELIWYELAEDETVFFAIEEDLTGNPTPTSKGKAPTPIPVSDNGPLPDSVAEKDLDGEDMPHKLPPFSAIARDAFWWTSLGSSQEYRQKEPERCIRLSRSRVVFLWRFYTALNAMSHIHTFISCVMPSLRMVCKEPYPLTAQLFQKGVGLWNPEQGNEGFFQFLLPAMRRPGSKIKHLAYADEGSGSSLLRLRPCDILAFKTLTHVDLCLGWLQSHQTRDDIQVCLSVATGLVDLRICMEKSLGGSFCHNDEHDIPLECLLGNEERQVWPHLQRLEFRETRTTLSDFRPSEGPPPKGLVRMLRAHAPTLRHLSFQHCSVTCALIDSIAKIPGLALESLHVNNEYSLDTRLVPGPELLAYVNGKGPCPINVGTDGAWNTDVMIFDPQLMPTAALFDASSTTETVYSKDDIASIVDHLHPEDSQLLRSHHSLYTREKRAKLKLPNDNSRASHGTATGESGLGSVVTESLPICKWLFKHPDGREAIGDEPLEFFSDWEDSCDENSVDGDEDVPDAPHYSDLVDDGQASDHEGPNGDAQTEDGNIGDEGGAEDEDDDDTDDSRCSWDTGSQVSNFNGDEAIAQLEAPIAISDNT